MLTEEKFTLRDSTIVEYEWDMITGQSILERLQLEPFQPHSFLKSGWSQTIAPTIWPQEPDRPYDIRHEVEVSDGDKLVVLESSPLFEKSKRIVTLVHGLTGCFQSHFMIRLAKKYQDEGFRVFRVNLRGCGPGFGLAKTPHNGSQSEDILKVMTTISALYPQQPITCIGFSLGGNIVLKMIGQNQPQDSTQLDSFAVVAPAIKLGSATEFMMRPENRLFDWYFARRLKRDIEKFQNRYPENQIPKLPKKMTIRTVDELVTAPLGGYSSANDYYEKASSAPYIKGIQLPGVILSAQDDPVVPTTDLLDLNPKNLEVVVTQHGGHVGFLSHSPKQRWWMDEFLNRWVKDFDQRSS